MANTDNRLGCSEPSTHRKKQSMWIKWGTVSAACVCFIIIGVIVWSKAELQSHHSANTLPGADKIYPTVMVQNHLYEWRKGAAICNEIPDNCVYYGELIHVEGEIPNNDNEFVSAFSASGQIYTTAEDDAVVYLCLTTDWLENTVVVFDMIESEISSL